MTINELEVEDFLAQFGITDFELTFMDSDVEAFLAHFGVLGMHWGIRNDNRWKTDPSLSKPNMSVNEINSKIVKHVNPGYGEKGTKLNCRRCTFAYELRRRGYDVHATRTRSPEDIRGYIKAVTPGKRFVSIYGVAKHARTFNTLYGKEPVMRKETEPHLDDGIFRTIGKHPNGARGELGVGWRSGGGHSMAWEIVKGKPVIFDNQNGKVYKNLKEWKKFSQNNVLIAGVTRLDNIPINDRFLSKWVANA